MLRMKTEVMHIDYDTLVELMMPHLVHWLTHQDNKLYGVISKMISKQGKPNLFSRVLFSAIPKKTEIMAWMIPHFNEMLMEYLNNRLKQYGVIAKVRELNALTIERSSKSMLRIELVIDDLDYEQTADNLLPIFLQQWSEKEEASRLPNLLIGLKKLPRQVLGAAVRAIPKDQRDELTCLFLNEYKEELTNTLNQLLIKKNMVAEIKEIHIDTNIH